MVLSGSNNSLTLDCGLRISDRHRWCCRQSIKYDSPCRSQYIRKAYTAMEKKQNEVRTWTAGDKGHSLNCELNRIRANPYQKRWSENHGIVGSGRITTRSAFEEEFPSCIFSVCAVGSLSAQPKPPHSIALFGGVEIGFHFFRASKKAGCLSGIGEYHGETWWEDCQNQEGRACRGLYSYNFMGVHIIFSISGTKTKALTAIVAKPMNGRTIPHAWSVLQVHKISILQASEGQKVPVHHTAIRN